MTEPEPIVWDEALPAHLSATQLSMFSRCPEQYRQRYLLGRKERPGAALVWGSADHYAHEVNFRQKIESHEDLPTGDVLDAFADGIAKSLDEHGGELEVEWGRVRLADVKDRGAQLVATYHSRVSPLVQPLAVEEKFELEVPGLPVPIIGYIDTETERAIIDRKTSSAKVTAPKPSWRLQGTLYQAAKRKPVSWHVGTKTKVPAVYTSLHPETPALHVPFEPTYVNVTLQRVTFLVESIARLFALYGPDNPWPTTAPDVGWRDNFCGYCGYRPECTWWANGLAA